MNFNAIIDSYREEMIRDVKRLVAIPSVMGAPEPLAPFGLEVNHALLTVLAICEELGFTTVNLEGYVGYAQVGEGEDYIAVLGHVDVVPEGTGWHHLPYGGEIHQGRLYGRGVLDDKGPLIAALYGLKAIVASGMLLKHKVRIIFGTNEESGSAEMPYYLEREKPPLVGFTPDAEFPIIRSEKGAIMMWVYKPVVESDENAHRLMEISGGIRPNIVPKECVAHLRTGDCEAIVKRFESKDRSETAGNAGVDVCQCQINVSQETDDPHHLRITIKGKESHGSTPELGVNSIQQMLECLAQFEISKDICTLYDVLGMDYEGKRLGITQENEDLSAGRLSVNVGMLHMNSKEIRMALDIRYPGSYDADRLLIETKERFSKIGFLTEVAMHLPALYYADTHPLIQTLSRVYVEQTGQPATHKAIGGSTYAKLMPNIVAFGALFPDEPETCHGPDENMKLDDLVLSAKIYAAAIFELGNLCLDYSDKPMESVE